MRSYLKKKITRDSQETIHLNYTYCDYLNVSICQITEKEDSVVMNVYNPTGRNVVHYIRLPVTSKQYMVFDSSGNPVVSQIARVSPETSTIRRGSHGSAGYELAFEALAPALGYSSYFIERIKKEKLSGTALFSEEHLMDSDKTSIENDYLKLEFSDQTGRLIRMTNKNEDLALDIEQQFFWYNASVGNKESIQTSGAYIFRPYRTLPFDVCDLNKGVIHITKGPVYEEVRQVFGTYVSQVIRLYKRANYAEFEHTVGPIPVADGLGKEIITRFDTNIESAGKFFTDANGREMKERIRDHRDTWKLNVTEPVAGNYYPVNSRIFIKDSNAQLTVMSDRSQGGGSINDGSLEVMVHRRLLRDDFLGVGEALDEPGIDGQGLVTRGRHRVLLSKPSNAAKLHRKHGELMMMPPVLRFINCCYFLFFSSIIQPAKLQKKQCRGVYF